MITIYLIGLITMGIGFYFMKNSHLHFVVSGFLLGIPNIFLGIYIILGKYVYFRGNKLSLEKKRLLGIVIMIFVPVIYFLLYWTLPP
jgi:hypothetical protein